MTSTLPRILVLDDIRGWCPGSRQQMCDELRLKNLNDGAASAQHTDYIAEAEFCPAQEVEGGRLVNKVELAVAAVAKHWDAASERRWRLVLLDLQFNQGPFQGDRPNPRGPRSWPKSPDREFGLRILEAMAARWPDPDDPRRTGVPVVVMSTRPRGELEAALNNLGNLGYLEREEAGGDVASSRRQFARHLCEFGLLEDGPITFVDASGRLVRRKRAGRIVGNSLPLLRALRLSRQAAQSNLGCLLLGRPGSGKELFARYLHDWSSRADGFEALNCAGMPDMLVESELFGLAPQSGVHNAPPTGRPGLFELANGGTVFLDEIGEMSPEAQAKVLRAVQFHVIRRVGATTDTQVDVRVVAATNRNLHGAVMEGGFREDLLHRLEGFTIRLPSLEERGDDVRLLFDYFLERATRQYQGASWPKRIDAQVYEDLRTRAWKGNVRELEKLTGQIASWRKYSPEVVPSDIPPIALGVRHFKGQQVQSSDEEVARLQPRTAELEDAMQTGPPGQAVAFDDLPTVLESVQLPDSSLLESKLASLQDAYGGLVKRLLGKVFC